MIKGFKEAQGRLREAQGTEKALKGTTSVLEAGLTPTNPIKGNSYSIETSSLTQQQERKLVKHSPSL